MRTTRFGCVVLGFAMLVPVLIAGEPQIILNDHAGSVNALAFSPNGKYLASGGADKILRIWEVSTGELLHSMTGHKGPIVSVAFRPDSYLLASAGGSDSENEVVIWEVGRGKFFKAHQFPAPVTRVAYGRKNAFAVACTDGSVHERYTCTGNTIISRQPTEVAQHLVAFRPDNSLLSSSGGFQPRLWDITADKEIAIFKEHTYLVEQIALSPDGKTLATVGVNDLKLWDAVTGELRFAPTGIFGHTYGLAFTADGRILITGGNNCHARSENGQPQVELNLWDVAIGKRNGTFSGKLTDDIFSVATSPDAKTFATSSRKGKITLWNLSEARPVAEVDSN